MAAIAFTDDPFCSREHRHARRQGACVTVDEYNAVCRELPHTTYVVQWGGSHVWKVGGKVFAIGGWNDADEALFVTFKCSPESYEMLKDMPGLRPAPYLASRGMTWIQRTSLESMDDGALRDYLTASHRLAAAGLPKRVQDELGLGPSRPASAPKRTAKPKNTGTRSKQ